jgi:hypothetical protein
LRHKTLILLAALIGLAMLAPPPAYGYLDPGTGSLIVQATIAAVVGIGTAMKLYWGRIREVFSRASRADPSE